MPASKNEKSLVFNLNKANCLDQDPDIFFSDDQNNYDRKTVKYAKSVCQPCSVSVECFNTAVKMGYEGIWGGTTETERATFLRRSTFKPSTRSLAAGIENNKLRAVEAAKKSMPEYEKAMELFGEFMPKDTRELLELRLNNPGMSFTEIGQAASIKMSKDMVAGRLRRIKTAIEQGKEPKW